MTEIIAEFPCHIMCLSDSSKGRSKTGYAYSIQDLITAKCIKSSASVFTAELSAIRTQLYSTWFPFLSLLPTRSMFNQPDHSTHSRYLPRDRFCWTFTCKRSARAVSCPMCSITGFVKSRHIYVHDEWSVYCITVFLSEHRLQKQF